MKAWKRSSLYNGSAASLSALIASTLGVAPTVVTSMQFARLLPRTSTMGAMKLFTLKFRVGVAVC